MGLSGRGERRETVLFFKYSCYCHELVEFTCTRLAENSHSEFPAERDKILVFGESTEYQSSLNPKAHPKYLSL